MQPNPFIIGSQYIQRHPFRVITTLVMVSWCIGLTTYTLHLQHSCTPLLPRSIPDSCKPKIAQTSPKPTSRLQKLKDYLIPEQLPKNLGVDWQQLQPVKRVPKRIQQVINNATDDLANIINTELDESSEISTAPLKDISTKDVTRYPGSLNLPILRDFEADSPQPLRSPKVPDLENNAPLTPKQISRDEAIAIVAGSAALVGLAVIEVPIIIAAGAGAAIWYAARTIVSIAF